MNYIKPKRKRFCDHSSAFFEYQNSSKKIEDFNTKIGCVLTGKWGFICTSSMKISFDSLCKFLRGVKKCAKMAKFPKSIFLPKTDTKLFSLEESVWDDLGQICKKTYENILKKKNL
ncbi:unnamed protein product [Meganyctiphanes norvegica]|uniref:Uncharacterized protein n=1 Tax=Meganyctiphanes norvegica TaxID=48144 RepID=A0AAV2RMV1_MEGNR